MKSCSHWLSRGRRRVRAGDPLYDYSTAVRPGIEIETVPQEWIEHS